MLNEHGWQFQDIFFPFWVDFVYSTEEVITSIDIKPANNFRLSAKNGLIAFSLLLIIVWSEERTMRFNKN